MGRHKTYDREDVLSKAMSLFWQLGYSGTHLSRLVEVTGLNRFSLYKEFGGKDGLFDEALARYESEATAYYHKYLGRAPQGLDNIVSYFANIDLGQEYKGCFMVNTLTDRDAVPEASFKRARAFVDMAEAHFATNLAAAVKRGDLSGHVDLSTIAKALVTFDQGIAVYGMARQDTPGLRAASGALLAGLLGLDPGALD